MDFAISFSEQVIQLGSQPTESTVPWEQLAHRWQCGKIYISIRVASLLFKITCNVFIFSSRWLSNLKHFSPVIQLLNYFLVAFVNRWVITITATMVANTYDCLSIRNLLYILSTLLSFMSAIIFGLGIPYILILFTKTIERPDFFGNWARIFHWCHLINHQLAGVHQICSRVSTETEDPSEMKS